MDLSLNLKTELCKQTFIKTINDLELPVGIAYYLLKDLTEDIGKTYFKSIAEEQENIQKQQKQANKEEQSTTEEQNQIIE